MSINTCEKKNGKWQHIIINLANVVILANMEVKAESSQNRRPTFIMHGSEFGKYGDTGIQETTLEKATCGSG